MRPQSVISIIAVAWALSAASGSAEDRLVDTGRSTITVHVFKSGLFSVFADDHVVQAPLMDGSLDDPATPHVQIVVDARRMQVMDPYLSAKDRQAVQARMLGTEVLDVDRFRWISFHSLEITPLDTGRWRVQGELELHGQIRPMAVNVSLEKGRYKGSATLRQSDFGIVPVSIVGGAVRVKDEVKVDFDIAVAERSAAPVRP